MKVDRQTGQPGYQPNLSQGFSVAISDSHESSYRLVPKLPGKEMPSASRFIRGLARHPQTRAATTNRTSVLAAILAYIRIKSGPIHTRFDSHARLPRSRIFRPRWPPRRPVPVGHRGPNNCPCLRALRDKPLPRIMEPPCRSHQRRIRANVI